MLWLSLIFNIIAVAGFSCAFSLSFHRADCNKLMKFFYGAAFTLSCITLGFSIRALF